METESLSEEDYEGFETEDALTIQAQPLEVERSEEIVKNSVDSKSEDKSIVFEDSPAVADVEIKLPEEIIEKKVVVDVSNDEIKNFEQVEAKNEDLLVADVEIKQPEESSEKKVAVDDMSKAK